MSQAGILDVESANPQIPTSFITDDGTAIPILNEIELLGEVVPNAGIPFQSTGSGNVVTYQIQYADETAATDATKVGLASFDSDSFAVDANGFVTLIGGSTAVDSFSVQSSTAPGTNPVLPTVGGLVTVNGAAVTNHSVVLESHSRADNTYNLEIQYATVSVGTDATKSGVAHFNSADFVVDANGFVTLGGAGAGQTITGDSGGPLSPTAGNWNILGTSTAAGTSPVVTSGLGSTLTVNVQKSQALAATDATKIGLSNFDSTSFAVDANGFVTLTGAGFTWSDVSGAFSPLKNNGYFITGTATGTLPAAPAQGDTIKFFVDHASQVLTIQATAGKIIRFGSLVSSAAGTFVSTLQGDSVELTYRTSDTCWCAIAGFSGTWTFT